jgi:hypothetical protein
MASSLEQAIAKGGGQDQEQGFDHELEPDILT